MLNAIKVLTGAALVLGLGAGTPPEIDLSKPTREQLAQLTKGEMAPGSTIRVPAGTALPVAIKMRGDVVGTLDPETKVTLKARRDVWLRFTGERVEASLDGVRYRPFTDVFSGSIAFALAADENGGNVRGELVLEMRTKPTE